MEWKTGIASLIRPLLFEQVLNGTETVVKFQKACGIVPAPNTKEGEEASVTGHKKQASDSDKGNESDDDKNGNNGATTEKKTGPNTSEGTARPPRKFGVSTNFFLHWLFTLGTAAGHEMFYIIVLPLIYWNANHIVSRRVVLIWVLTYYCGQACKDWLKLPRPASPPVLRLSSFYEAEYGLPSTHAMGAVAISFSIVLAVYQVGYDIALIPWLLAAAAYTAVVSTSRLYMGAHTVIDLVAGLVLSFGILGLYLLVGDAVDAWLATSPWVPVVVPAVAIALLYIYPVSNVWSESFGDTTCFLAVGTGGMLAHWHFATPALVPGMIPEASLISTSNLGMHVLRCLIGYVVIVCCRSFVKQICLFVVPRLVLYPENEYRFNQRLILDNPSSSVEHKNTTLDKKMSKEDMYWKYFWGGYMQNYAVEIPTKLITYTLITYYAAYIDPVCDYAGLRLL